MLAALGVWIAVILAIVVAQRVLIRWLDRRAATTSTSIDNFFVAMLRKTRFAFVLFAAMAAASATLNLPPRLRFAPAGLGVVSNLVQPEQSLIVNRERFLRIPQSQKLSEFAAQRREVKSAPGTFRVIPRPLFGDIERLLKNR